MGDSSNDFKWWYNPDKVPTGLETAYGFNYDDPKFVQLRADPKKEKIELPGDKKEKVALSKEEEADNKVEE